MDSFPHDMKWMVLHSGDDPRTGGIQRLCHEIIRILRENQILGPIIGPDKNNFIVAKKYLKEVKNWNGGLIVMHSGLSKLFWLKVPSGPKVIFIHGIEVWKNLSLFQRIAMSRSSKFLFNSLFTKEKFLRYHKGFLAFPNEVVQLGLNEPIDFIEENLNITAALTIGRLSKEGNKGHQELIRSWPLVLDKIPTAQLWIAGDGPLRQTLEDQARGIPGIIFYGNVTDAQKNELLLKSRCLAMPSRSEGFGLVYAEAMRYGRPCLVSDEDAGREVVNPPEAGLAVNQKDLNGIANSLLFLLGQSDQRKAMCLNAKKRYDNNFTSTMFKKRLLCELRKFVI